MSAAGLETVQRVYARWARGDWSDASEFAEDVVVTTFDADGDEVVCHSRAEVAEWLRTFLQQWTDFRKEIAEIDQVGTRILVVCNQSGAGRTSGIPLEMQTYDVWTVEDGQVVEMYSSRHEEAAREKLNAR